MSSPSFYAIIPADVRYCTTITDGAKLLYGEITALCNEKGYCWASNSYFSELYKCSPDTISRWVKSLYDSGFIEVEIDRSKGNQRRITICSSLSAKMPIPIRKNADTLSAKMPIPIRKNAEQNNTGNTYNEIVNLSTANAPDYLTLKAEKEKKAPPVPAAPPAPVFNPDGWRHPEEAAQAVATWLQYKRSEKKGSYKAQKSFDIAVGQWLRMFGGCGRTLQESVTQSISNGWSGLFPVKVNRPAQAARATGIQAWDNDRPELQQKQAF